MSRSGQIAPIASLYCISVLLAAWAMSVLLAGRVVPWQATRQWLMVFAVVAAVVVVWWWPACKGLVRLSAHRKGYWKSLAWAFAPPIGACAVVLAVTYLSDDAYSFLVHPSVRMQVAAAAAVVLLAMSTSARAAAVWSGDRNVTVAGAFVKGFSASALPIALTCLLAVGVLQGAAMSTPIGDDIGKYTEAALAMLDGRPYPVHQATTYLVEAGMTGASPALPGLPVLLAGSFALLGRNFAGLALPLAALAAIFPLAMYFACLALTRSRLAAYAGAVLLTLFPTYQIHILGTAVPDTLFVVVLLFAAAAVARALERKSTLSWALAGASVGLVANSRPEGLSFSLAILGLLGLMNWSTRQYWVSVLFYLLLIAPFSLTYLQVAGSPWPTTFGGTVGLQHLETNLRYLRELSLPWYSQAIGLDVPMLALLGVVVALGGLASLIALGREQPGLLFVPLLGYGYIAASLLIHPLILMSYTPVDVLRHWSSGVPYVVATLTYAIHRWWSYAERGLPVALKWVALAAVAVVLSLGIFYEIERLARPEWYLGGKWSLLWTGGSYPLVDVTRDPIPLPAPGDTRSGEELRQVQSKQLEPYDIRYTNGAEPYQWSTLIIALFGLFHTALAATGSLGSREPRAASAVEERLAPAS